MTAAEISQIEQNNRILKSSIEKIEKLIEVGVTKKYYNISDASLFTGLGKATLRKEKEKIGYSIVKGMIFFKKSDLEKYMESIYNPPMNFTNSRIMSGEQTKRRGSLERK